MVFVDENSVSCFIDENSVTCFIDENSVELCCAPVGGPVVRLKYRRKGV